MSTLSLVRLYWPAYDGVSDDVVNAMIANAAAEIGLSASEWGVLYGRAIAALTAHALEIRARSAAAADGGAGTGSTALTTATSLKTGDLAIGYGDAARLVGDSASAGLGDRVYASTPGGQEYLRLRGRLAQILVVVA